MYFKARLSKFEFPIDIQEIYPTGRLSKTNYTWSEYSRCTARWHFSGMEVPLLAALFLLYLSQSVTFLPEGIVIGLGFFCISL